MDVCTETLAEFEMDVCTDSLAEFEVDVRTDYLAEFEMDVCTETLAEFEMDVCTDSLAEFEVDVRTDYLAEFEVDVRTDYLAEFEMDVCTDSLAEFEMDVHTGSLAEFEMDVHTGSLAEFEVDACTDSLAGFEMDVFTDCQSLSTVGHISSALDEVHNVMLNRNKCSIICCVGNGGTVSRGARGKIRGLKEREVRQDTSHHTGFNLCGAKIIDVPVEERRGMSPLSSFDGSAEPSWPPRFWSKVWGSDKRRENIQAGDSSMRETLRGPRITGCRSPQLETFTCYWTHGDFQNLSTSIKFQYRTSDHQWTDCPDTESAGGNSCYFSKEHTSVLWDYSIRLVSENVTFDESSFNIYEIAEPNPPTNLSCSVLDINTNLQLMDIQITWMPPPTLGQLEYEVQIKEATQTQWKVYSVVGSTQLSLYRVKMRKQYLMRVRCRQRDDGKFGEFSDVVEIPLFTSTGKYDICSPYLKELSGSSKQPNSNSQKELSSTAKSIRGPMQRNMKKTYPPGWPRITECQSSQLETFTCHWTYGEFQNLTGLLKLQYKKTGLNWTDCPDTVSAGENGCFFSKDYTSIWVQYHVRLVSDNVTYYEYTFTIDEIERSTPNPRKQLSFMTVSTRVPLQKIIKKTYHPGWPRITECRSPQQETFTCHWTYGEFQNLTGLIKLQYRKPGLNWTDCPDAVSAGENGCYFNKNYTSIWVGYQVRLVSDNVTFYEYSFTVDEIVRPDPPMALNWTSLNFSETGLHMDIELIWLPPATADVESGWITLEYEVQIKIANATKWKTYDTVTTTYLSIYGLKTGNEYWMRIRCKQKGSYAFSEFSELLIVQPPLRFPDSPWPLFVITGLFAVVVMLVFFLFCKKKRLKMLILPPVPVPKIKGIDPALLQKGKLDEVSSILASHDSYKQQLCIDDPWVEFIELDLDDQDEKNEGTDTDRLLGEEYPKAHSCLGVKDDDSGRASCCEPDIPETDFSNSETCDGTSDTGQPHNTKDNQADLLCLSEKPNSTNSLMPNVEKTSTKPEDAKLNPLIANGTTNVPTSTQLIGSKPSMDFYALVSDITPAGRLLLLPGQIMRMEHEECSEPAATQRPTTLNMDSPYICESAMTAFCPVNFPAENAPQNPSMDSYFTPESLTAAAMSSLASEKASSYETPVADYTSVHILNSPQNLVLNTTAPPGKEFTPPCGYMSTDQVNKVMP
ncbi:growth hormone receptor [Mantella aurantiaca]